MEFKNIINEVLTKNLLDKINSVKKEIETNKDLKELIDHIRIEIYKYKGKYGLLVILKSNLIDDDEIIIKNYLKEIVKKYGATVQRNNIVIKILFKEEGNEVQTNIK